MKKVLAIDMGATSIRGIIGFLEDAKIKMEEVMRLSHKIVEKEGRMRWQWEELLGTIQKTIKDHKEEIVSVGIDTWGVDFGFLDKEGKLIEEPIAYRDPSHKEGYRAALSETSLEEIFTETGTQIMEINTLFQLLALKKISLESFRKIDKIVMMPDLVGYFLTGNPVGEETIWSTSQILNLKTGKYSEKLLKLLDLKEEVFPEIVKAGTKTGKVKDTDISVVSVCGHDTASAVLLTEAMRNPECMFLSCGTWSLFGAKVEEARLTKEVYAADLTNELGYGSANLLFKNITGLYLLEKYKAELEETFGKKIAFTEITEFVEESFKKDGSVKNILDMDDPRFADESLPAKEAMEACLKEKGLTCPTENFEYFRIIYDSLISKYMETKELIEKETGVSYKKLHMIGGGAKSSVLCGRIADRMGLPVVAGPFEASALGNILIQLVAAGEVRDMEEAVNLVLTTCETKTYQPKHSN